MKALFQGAGLFLLLVAAVAGCGGGGYRVTGKLTKGGAPIKVSEKGLIQMAFIEESDKQAVNPFPVSVNKDGTFEVNGRAELKGPPAGKYRVSVELIDPYPGTDKFQGKYSKQNSPIIKEVTGNQELTVDLN